MTKVRNGFSHNPWVQTLVVFRHAFSPGNYDIQKNQMVGRKKKYIPKVYTSSLNYTINIQFVKPPN